MATEVLEQYAADDLTSLAELLLDAEPKQFVALFDEFAAHGDDALSKLNEELDRTLDFHWNDPPLDPSWIEPTAEVTGKIKQAHGMITERLAFCQTMPLAEFTQAAEELRKSGYRPIRLRPFAQDNSVHVAAAWVRDDRDWRTANGLSADAIQQRDAEQLAEGFVAVDIAGYIGESDGTPAELYSILWMKKRDDTEDTHFFIGATNAEYNAAYLALTKDGYTFQHSLQVYRSLDGQARYSGVKTKASETSRLSSQQTAAVFESKEYFDMIHWDIDLSNSSDASTTKERYEKVLADAEAKLKEKPDDVNDRLASGTAYFHLGKDEQAVEDFNFVIEKVASYSGSYKYRSVLHARMGNAEEAKQDLVKFTEVDTSASAKAYLDAIVAAYLGEDAEAMKRLEAFIEENKEDTDAFYNSAYAYSIASGAFKETDAAKSKVYANQAISLITQAVSQGYSNYSHMQKDADLDPIRQQDGFIKIMQAGNLALHYATVWNTSTEFESLESHGLSPAEHLLQCQEMQSNGYRLTSISSASINGELVTASVWHRPLIPDDEKEILARRQANAAVAALRMDQGGKVWPLLKHSPDPRLRTWIIHRLSPLGASPDNIVKRLKEEPDVSIRRALILVLGEYGDGPQIDRKATAAELLELYRDDPDPGIHGAAEWVLKRWGMGEDIAIIDTELATGKVEDERQWYVTQQGHTMVVIPGPVEFLMGSPATEKERHASEHLHRKRIGRSFAIASKEVTVRQFQEFLRNTPVARHTYAKRYAPEENYPQISVTWYEAAAYCRWLSEQEGIPEDQMCYPSIAEIKEGMKLPSDYLSRTGYRLPGEAEWEYACRSNAVTSGCYGVADELLGQYAWFTKTSQERTWPVGSLKPNDTGLFDMQGNVNEWCQERYVSYSGSLGSVSEDREDNTSIRDSTSRLLRSGSFSYLASDVRSAQRNNDQPRTRSVTYGFRPSRTLPLVSLTPLPPTAEGGQN
jgi:formylglycine-generating enzyme required for sulfatase activity